MFAVVLFTVGILLILSELGSGAQGLGWGNHQEKPRLIPTRATLMVFLSSCRQEVQVQFSPEAQVSEVLCCIALGGKAAVHATGAPSSGGRACCSRCQLLSLCSSPCRAPGDEEAQGENLITSNGKATLFRVCSGQENALT